MSPHKRTCRVTYVDNRAQTGQPLVMGILNYGNDVGDGTTVSTGA